jgi:hypothetical protein
MGPIRDREDRSMKIIDLDALLVGILPRLSSRRAAAVVGMNPRSLQRLLTDPDAVLRPQTLWLIEHQRTTVAKSRIRERLMELLAAADIAGVENEVVGACLEDAHVKVTGKRIE